MRIEGFSSSRADHFAGRGRACDAQNDRSGRRHACAHERVAMPGVPVDSREAFVAQRSHGIDVEIDDGRGDVVLAQKPCSGPADGP